jgi:hypothetical protein
LYVARSSISAIWSESRKRSSSAGGSARRKTRVLGYNGRRSIVEFRHLDSGVYGG